MKIAYIGQKGIPATLGGVEKHTEEIAIRMAQKGHQVFVYARSNYTPKELKEYQGVKIIQLPSIKTKNLDAISHTFLASLHALFQNYDIIHYQSIGPASLSFLPRFFQRKAKVVATYHCQDYLHQKWSWFARAYLKFGEYITAKIPEKIFVVTEILKKYLKLKFGADSVVIPNGMKVQPTDKVDHLQQWNLSKGNYILSVSRLIRHKGLHHLIKAFEQLEQEGKTKGKKLVIVGEGFYTDTYVQEIQELAKKDPNIIFTGKQSGETLRQLFSNAYLFVQPSEAEGLSIALLEAMGYGLPILASDIEENYSVIKNVGLSFKNKDVNDLKEKIKYALDNAGTIKMLAQKSKNKAEEEFNWDKISDKLENCYEELLKKELNLVTEKI